MNGWHRVMAGLMLSLLAGCGNGGEQEGSGATERLGGVAQPEEATQPGEGEEAERVAEPAPFDQDVAFDMSIRLDASSRLLVEGTTNLPSGTRLRVMAERDASGVSWRERVEVGPDGFAAGPFGPGSGLPEGIYRLRVTMPPISVQPSAVQSRLGQRGEHLSGPWVVSSEHGLGQVVEARWSLRIEPDGVRMMP
ncbi:hypothetical protein [Halomonas caseinilytica]|uniref:hypothetical protein n=1 Tax=Halomonas caseinilytica TaxID=438744 RepID=UPI0008489B76|nr:hypothetical protein [Halomonas caseinilytica]